MALQIAALNDPTRGGGRHGSAAARAAARRTTEAEESRLTSKYEHALLFMRDGALEDAERELRSILDHDMMSGPPNHRPVEEYPAPPPKPTRDAEDSDTDDNSEYESEDDTPEMTLTSTMTQVKFLALKNLGRLVADRAERRERENDDDFNDARQLHLDADFAPPPPGYALLGLSAETTLGKVRVGAEVHNLLNTAYRDYTSLLRYYADQPGRDIRVRVGMDF